MGWKTADYDCPNCGTFDTLWQLSAGEPIPDTAVCGACDAVSPRRYTTTVLEASYPDGTRRFQGVREQRVLAREAKRAARKGDRKEQTRVAIEAAKLKGK